MTAGVSLAAAVLGIAAVLVWWHRHEQRRLARMTPEQRAADELDSQTW